MTTLRSDASRAQGIERTQLLDAADLIAELQATEVKLRSMWAESRDRCLNYFRAQLQLVEEIASLQDELDATRESRDLAEQRRDVLELENRSLRFTLEARGPEPEHKGIDWSVARMAARVLP